MSITGISNSEKLYKMSTHRRKDSGELDVFEAARYFSGGTEFAGFNGSSYYQNTMKEDRKIRGGGRMSLDMSMRNQISSQPHRVEKQIKEKKYKQPSSPGGKLASFLNSLFNQTTSRKKKSKSVKDEDESPCGRRKRRSSISHFRSVSVTDSKTLYSSSNSVFKTPQVPYEDSPILSKCNGKVRSVALQDGILYEKGNMDFPWLDEKLKFLSKNKKNCGYLDKDRIRVNGFSSEEKNFKRYDYEDEDSGESDSSSDLFELPNYDLGLPVYETTHMESMIKRGVPISNGSL